MSGPVHEWASHQPLIHTVMERLHPMMVMELGIGMYSTPVFHEYNCEYYGEESDLEWIKKMKYELIAHYDLGPNIKSDTFLKNISEHDRNNITKHYEELYIPDGRPNLLFVDSFTCTRNIAINTLYHKFDAIMYHDCQDPEGIEWYEYNFNYDLWNRYDHFTLKTKIAWTGLFIDKKYCCTLGELESIAQPHIKSYENTYGTNKVKAWLTQP